MQQSTTPLFFFGSLMDKEVLEIVLGRPMDTDLLKTGTLRGYRCEREAKESYPILIPCPGGEAKVLLADSLGQEDIQRILFYETGEYDLVPFTITSDSKQVTALGFATGENIHTSGETWQLEAWQNKDKQAFRPMASKFMEGYGKMSILQALEYWDVLAEKFEQSASKEQQSTGT